MEPIPSMAQNFHTHTLTGTKFWPKSIPLLVQNPTKIVHKFKFWRIVQKVLLFTAKCDILQSL